MTTIEQDTDAPAIGDITLHNRLAKYGMPIILDTKGRPFPCQVSATQLAMREIGWTTRDLAKAINRSPRTVEKYFYRGLGIPGEALNVLMLAWTAKQKKAKRKASRK